MARRDVYQFDKIPVYKLADTVLLFTTNEEYFYQQCGVNARYIPMLINHKKQTEIVPITHRKLIVLWCGRLDNIKKNFTDALKIFKCIVRENNNIICYIVGSGKKIIMFYIKLYIYLNRLYNNVIYVPYTKNIELFYKIASVQLVTSSFESFSMVIAESKSFGVPLVTYELPMLDLLKDGKGYVSVKCHDIQAASKSILEIFNNKNYMEHLSREARESIEPFLNYDFDEEWAKLLADPCKKHFHNTVPAENIDNNCLFWNYMLTMYESGLRRINLTNYIKQTLILVIKITKLVLKPFLPIGSYRRFIVIKICQYFKSLFNFK